MNNTKEFDQYTLDTEISVQYATMQIAEMDKNK